VVIFALLFVRFAVDARILDRNESLVQRGANRFALRRPML
jgi:hypothetical protein